MLRKPAHTGEGELSFFYLMIAKCCFQRSISTRHPNAAGTLREMGRNYLTSASNVASTLDSKSLAMVMRRSLG